MRLNRVILCSLIILSALYSAELKRYVNIKLANHNEVYKLGKYTLVDAGRDYARAILTDKEIGELRIQGYDIEILIPDFQAYKDEIFNRGFYRTYAQVYLTLDSFVTNYPGICHLDTIGFSVQGRAIWAMRVTDNPLVEENEAEIRLAGNMHGDEHIGTEITIYYLRYLLTNYGSNSQVQNLVNNREIWILPTLNPDGKVANTRENANGVDINRDYGFMWASWGGSPGPSSQIENQAMMQHLIQNNIALEYNYHSLSFYVNYPWDYHPADPPDSQFIITLSQIYADSANLTIINGYDWYQVCGSLQDYTFGISGALAWTIETDEPSGSSAIDQICYDNRDGLMELCNRAGWGMEGVARDSVTNSPLYARIEFTSPERVTIFTDPSLGDFHKMLAAGTYSIRVSANGYVPKTVSGIVVPASGSVNVGDVRLASDPTWLYAFRSVIACYSQHAEQSNKTQPRSALGANDNVFFSLGQDGFIVLDMGPSTPVVNISGDDFTVYEGNDGTTEGYVVYASNNWNGPWNSCGSGTGTMDFDLAVAGMSQARYLRIVDDGTSSSGQYAGFDLDAIRFFASTTGLPAVPTIVKPLDFGRLPDLNPTLTFSSTDPQGDQIRYRVMWDTDPAFASPESSTTANYASGAVVNFNFPSNLANGATYWWKVKCSDPAGSGFWTQYATPRSFTVDTSLPTNTCSWYQTTAAQFGFSTFNGTQVQGDSVVLQAAGYVLDTLLAQNFESGSMPSGWTVVNGNGDAYYWVVGTSGDLGSYTPPDYGSYYAYYSDDDAGSGVINNNEELLSPKIYVPATAATLSLAYGYGFQVYQAGEKYRLKFRKKTNPGAWTAWTDQVVYATSVSGTQTVDLTSQLPCDSVQFDWFFSDSTASSHWGYACGADNVLLTYDYTFQNDYGTLTGSLVDYKELSRTYARTKWGWMVWRKASGGDSIGLQAEFYNGSTWALVPNGVLPGNSVGFFTQAATDSIDLSGLDTNTYRNLRLKTSFYRKAKAPTNPALLDWEVGNLHRLIGVAEQTAGGLGTFALSVAPNPFNRNLAINFAIRNPTPPFPSPLEGEDKAGGDFPCLKIFDAAGRIVKVFNHLTNYQSPVNQIVWDGSDDLGRAVPAGVYFVRLEAEGAKRTEKAVLLR